MQILFREISKKNINILALNLNNTYWTQHPSYSLTHSLYQEVNKHISSPSTKMVFNSHTGYFKYNTSNIKYHKSIEYTQVVRECQSRGISEFLYHLYSSGAAKEASKKQMATEHFIKYLNLDETASETDIAQCLHNDTCLGNALNMEEKYQYYSNFMGDCSSVGKYNCVNPSQRIAAVAENIAVSGAYKTFGITEHLLEYLEMLECAYPKLLGGIVKLFEKRPLHSNHEERPAYDNLTKATVSKVMSMKCLNSTDEYIYSAFINKTFWKRYNAMKASPQSCCRPSKSARI